MNSCHNKMNNRQEYKERLLNRVPLKIFSYLCKVIHSPHYEREIARAIGVSIGATSQTLNLLLNIGLVTREKKGQLNLYRVVADDPLVREFKIFENILDLRQLVLNLGKLSNKIVLYGSCAKGEDTVESDIDLFIISGEKEKLRSEIKKFVEILDREIRPVIVSIEEYLSLRNKKEAFLEEVEGGIILWEKK